MLTYPSGLYSGYKISALRGCWPLKFVHALEIDQGLLTHTTNLVGGPRKNFKGEHLQLGLKFHKCAPITLEVVGITSLNFTSGRRSRPGDNVDTNFARGAPTKFERVKMSKIQRDFSQL